MIFNVHFTHTNNKSFEPMATTRFSISRELYEELSLTESKLKSTLDYFNKKNMTGQERLFFKVWADEDLAVSEYGLVEVIDPENSSLQLANSESGIIQDVPDNIFLRMLFRLLAKYPLIFRTSPMNLR